VVRVIAIALFMGIAIRFSDQFLVNQIVHHRMVSFVIDALIGIAVYFFLVRLFMKHKLEYLKKMIKKSH